MTTDTTPLAPTDAEIVAFAVENGVRVRTGKGAIKLVRAALARWGQSYGAGEVDRADAVNLARNCLGAHNCVITKKGMRVLAEAVLAMDAALSTPQPTQAQAGAVPLTCEWAHNEDDGFWDTECGQSWRFDDGGPKENHMNFCHCCGKPLRIKGCQHGAE